MRTIYFLFTVLVLSACSSYNDVLKGDDFAAKFELANGLHEDGDYDKCIVLYEQVYQHAPKSSEGELSYYKMAKSYYKIQPTKMESWHI